MKKTFTILIFFFSTHGFAQNAIDKTKASSTIEMLNEANRLVETNAAQSMSLATTALEKSISEEDKTAEYHFYNTLGTLYYNIGNYAKAAEYFKKST